MHFGYIIAIVSLILPFQYIVYKVMWATRMMDNQGYFFPLTKGVKALLHIPYLNLVAVTIMYAMCKEMYDE